jgi:hypothetical protein
MRKCPSCGNDCADNAYTCPKCGYVFKQQKQGLTFWGVVGAILVAALLISLGL